MYFAKELKLASTSNVKTTALHVDYISTKAVLRNKQVLDKAQNKVQETTQENVKNFTQQNSLINSKGAYEGNSKMFSLFKLPSTSLNQTPSFEKTLPQEPKEVKELNMRHKMVNTYIANDNYYKVTA
ncbi:MAG: hypothetical protein Q9M43_01665 [Sulfurimonas sp.]|nr:hypothetical protein [Sulfurimonas sp.]